MSAPAVSVLIPTYNRASLIARTIECVLTQTYSNCHVIVVDDGSTDSTGRVIADLYGKNPRVRYVHQANRGVSAARNAALAVADGDYVAFLDSDDVWRPWKLEVQVPVLEALRPHGVGMLWGDMDLVDEAGTVLTANANRTSYSAYKLFTTGEMFTSSKLIRDLVPGITEPVPDTRVFWGDVYSKILMGNLCPTPSVILTRERAKQVGDFDESMKSGEDHDYHLRTCAAGDAAFLDVATFSYRKGAADQLTGTDYRLLIAQNGLRTILAGLERSRDRVKLPPEVVSKKLASAHAWIGTLMLDAKDNAGAREHFRKSLAYRPRQANIAAKLVAAYLPAPVTDSLRVALRRAKGLVRRAK